MHVVTPSLQIKHEEQKPMIETHKQNSKSKQDDNRMLKVTER